MYSMELTREAVEDLRALRKYDQNVILTGLQEQLVHQPDQETRHRKRLRPNQLAEWELRLGDFRIFYDADADVSLVRIVAIGEKRGDRLFMRGEEFEL